MACGQVGPEGCGGQPPKSGCAKNSAPGRNRTGDLALRRHSLYPLSYRGREEGRSFPAFRIGGGEGDRNLDLRIANATLSQLSYSPKTAQDTSSKRPVSQRITKLR